MVKIQTFTLDDKEKPYQDVDVAIFLGSMPRKPGMDRNDVYETNAEIFQKQGGYLNEVAKKSCKSLVIANPVVLMISRLVQTAWYWRATHPASRLPTLRP